MTLQECRDNTEHDWEIDRAEEDDHQHVRIWFSCNVCGETFDTIFHTDVFRQWLPVPEEEE
jgi:hypothetical protein